MTARLAACLAAAALLLTSCNASNDATSHRVAANTTAATSELEHTLEKLLLPDGCAAPVARAASSADAIATLLLPSATTSTTEPCAARTSNGP